MLRAALAFRFVLLVGCFGAALGALVMLCLGGVKLFGAITAGAAGHDTRLVVGGVMAATDAFLFALVLLVFAYGIAFGFVFRLAQEAQEELPDWMRVHSLSELKHRLIEVILLYLIVDFASDWAEGSMNADWTLLTKPLAILVIAGAAYFMRAGHGEH
jgi:uncharacterized membrane protein YqhA